MEKVVRLVLALCAITTLMVIGTKLGSIAESLVWIERAVAAEKSAP